MTTEELINKPLDLETMKKVYDRLNKEVDKMEKKNFNIFYRTKEGVTLECRQCSHRSRLCAINEAMLYREWAEYHYECEVLFEVREQ